MPSVNGCDQRVAGDHAAERGVARGHALGERDDVGLVTVTLRAEVVAEPAERADHLVGHQQHAVLVADLADPLEVPGRRREAAAGVLHRLEVHGGDRLGAFPLDGPVDLVGRPPAEGLQVVGDEIGRPVEVGVRHPDAARGHRLERGLDRGQAGDRQCAHGRAVVGDLAADHLVPAWLADGLEVLLGQLPGRLHRLRAAGGEEHPVQVAGGQVGQPGRQLDGPRVGVGPQREVSQLRRLRRARLGELGPAVPDLADEQPGQPVQVALAVLVVHVRAGAADDDRHLGVLVGRHAGEVQPEVPPGGLLQRLVGHRLGTGLVESSSRSP